MISAEPDLAERSADPPARTRSGVILIVDTGPLMAAFNKNRAHEVCAELLATTSAQVIIPAPVLTEVCYLIDTRNGTRAPGGLPHRAGQGHHDTPIDHHIQPPPDG